MCHKTHVVLDFTDCGCFNIRCQLDGIHLGDLMLISWQTLTACLQSKASLSEDQWEGKVFTQLARSLAEKNEKRPFLLMAGVVHLLPLFDINLVSPVIFQPMKKKMSIPCHGFTKEMIVLTGFCLLLLQGHILGFLVKVWFKILEHTFCLQASLILMNLLTGSLHSP